MHEEFRPENSRRMVSCPYCRSTDTDLLSLFGQQLLTEQYYCNACHTPFEHIRDDTIRAEREATGIPDQGSSS